MTSTKYLFDKSRAAYEPEISLLAARRVADARALIKKLSKLKEYFHMMAEEEADNIKKRYAAATKAMNFWIDIMEEE